MRSGICNGAVWYALRRLGEGDAGMAEDRLKLNRGNLPRYGRAKGNLRYGVTTLPAKDNRKDLSGMDEKILQTVEAYHLNELCYPTGKTK